MEIQIKKAIKAGNSSAVILPKSWLNKDVRIELVKKTPEAILLDTINITKEYLNLKNVIGIYLVGSYARSEEDKDSDIDILIITDNIDKELIRDGTYNILIISKELLRQKLNNDLLPIGPMLKEAMPLLNANYLSKIKIKVTKENIRWYLKTTEEKLKIIKKIFDIERSKNKRYVDDAIAYTLVLRIRTLYIIDKLIKNEAYSKKEFIKLIKKVSLGETAYEGYLEVKHNEKRKQKTRIDEAERLYNYLKNQLVDVKTNVVSPMNLVPG